MRTTEERGLLDRVAHLHWRLEGLRADEARDQLRESRAVDRWRWPSGSGSPPDPSVAAMGSTSHKVIDEAVRNVHKLLEVLEAGQTPEWKQSVDLLKGGVGLDSVTSARGAPGQLGTALFIMTQVSAGGVAWEEARKTCIDDLEALLTHLEHRQQQVITEEIALGTLRVAAVGFPSKRDDLLRDGLEAQLASEIEDAIAALRRAIGRRKLRKVGEAWLFGT